jgi:hypothetical protein
VVDVSSQDGGLPPVSGAPASGPPELEVDPLEEVPEPLDEAPDPEEVPLFVTPISVLVVPFVHEAHDRPTR